MNIKRDWITQKNPDALLWDGLDAAIIGIAERCGQPPTAVYDREQAIAILAKEMTEEDAEEYFDFNVACAYIGALTPFVMDRIPMHELHTRDYLARLRDLPHPSLLDVDEAIAQIIALRAEVERLRTAVTVWSAADAEWMSIDVPTRTALNTLRDADKALRDAVGLPSPRTYDDPTEWFDGVTE